MKPISSYLIIAGTETMTVPATSLAKALVWVKKQRPLIGVFYSKKQMDYLIQVISSYKGGKPRLLPKAQKQRGMQEEYEDGHLDE